MEHEAKDNPRIMAMIRLLDDPDQEVFTHISSELVALGREAVPILEEAWSGAFDPLMQERIENIVHRIQFEGLKADLAAWARSGNPDLLSGTMLVARYQYPDLDEEKIRTTINKIKRDIWLELNEQQTPMEQVAVINKILFDKYGFGGNTANFHAPQNSFINMVLETKKGNPLLLSVIYIIVSQQLDVPVFGVNLPEHFILAYQDVRGNRPEQYTYPEAGILFYVNAFSRGTIFGKSDIDQFLKKLDLKYNRIFYEPCTNIDMVRRMLRNLAFSWQKLGEPEKVEEINTLIECLNPRTISS